MMLKTLIGRQGIYKESRTFYAVRIEEVILTESELSLLLTIEGDSFAEYTHGAMDFKTIPLENERRFRFGKMQQEDILEQLHSEEPILSFWVMYVGDLIVGDESAIQKFMQQDLFFWDDYK